MYEHLRYWIFHIIAISQNIYYLLELALQSQLGLQYLCILNFLSFLNGMSSADSDTLESILHLTKLNLLSKTEKEVFKKI